ncbi:MAG: ABC transporter substrate-binding protein [bacterium]|nr:ABC transporter substrate-binding protein [bacterium]
MSKRILVLLIVVLGLSLAAINCKKVNKGTRGVTDTTIKIGQWGPQSGPAALWGSVARGTGCYFKMINDEGGINGRKIEYTIRDDGYQPSKTKTEAKAFVEKEGVFAVVGGVGTATGMAVKKYLIDNKVPWVSPTAGSHHWAYPPTKYIFSSYPTYGSEAVIMTNYAVETLKKKKVAIFYQNDDYGKFGLHGAELALKKHNLTLVEKVSVEVTDTDLSSHALKLKNSGAEIVLLWVLPKQAATIVATAAKSGYKPQWMASTTLSDMAIMFKITKGLWKGVIFSNMVELADSDSALMKKYRAAHKKFAPKERWGVFFYVGMMFAEPMVEAMKKSGKNLTVDSFVKNMESIKDFQGIGPKLSFGPNQRQGADSVFLSRCETAEKAEKLTDWITSDIDVKKIIEKLEK